MAIMQKIRNNLVMMAAAGALALTACGPQEPSGPSGGPGGIPSSASNGKTICYEANSKVEAGLVYLWHGDGAYGSNNVFIHELTDNCVGADFCIEEGLEEKATLKKDYVLEWHQDVPDSAWSAKRTMSLDGNDPRKFTEKDPLIVGYLPYIPKSTTPWKSRNSEYDWSCEKDEGESQGQTGGLENCLGLNQLDKQFSLNTLTPGKKYLARMLFGGNPNNQGNWIGFCSQKVFEYKK